MLHASTKLLTKPNPANRQMNINKSGAFATELKINHISPHLWESKERSAVGGEASVGSPLSYILITLACKLLNYEGQI